MWKDLLPVGIGVLGGGMLAPFVLNALGVAPSPGFGLDDVLTVGVITASILLAYKIV